MVASSRMERQSCCGGPENILSRISTVKTAYGDLPGSSKNVAYISGRSLAARRAHSTLSLRLRPAVQYSARGLPIK
uniref:Uncharacterized protein n=1 Tax=Anguilla anguilla TaxID=7936 RepID=A0A0E9UM69_ANGAN